MGDRNRLTHRIVNAVWKYSGMRAWYQLVQRLLKDEPKEQQ